MAERMFKSGAKSLDEEIERLLAAIDNQDRMIAQLYAAIDEHEDQKIELRKRVKRLQGGTL